MAMSDQEWRVYLNRLPWLCSQCGSNHVGAREREPGRVTGYCPVKNMTVLLYIWGSTSWIDAQANSVILETD